MTLRFDELVVFSDVSDVFDEATHYFCEDDDPKYPNYCDPAERASFNSICRAADVGRKAPCDVVPYRYSRRVRGGEAAFALNIHYLIEKILGCSTRHEPA